MTEDTQWQQQCLPFEFEVTENAREQQIEKKQENHFDNPKDDNERLLNMQYAYRHGDAAALDSMYRLGRTIALKYINAQAQRNRHIADMDREERIEKAHNAITYIITRYLRVADFAITESFTGYLYLRVQHELFYRRKVDKIVNFVDWEIFRGKE